MKKMMKVSGCCVCVWVLCKGNDDGDDDDDDSGGNDDDDERDNHCYLHSTSLHFLLYFDLFSI